MTNTRRKSETPRARVTIGLLIGRLGDLGYAARVWPGVAAVAVERDVHLVCFVGGALNALHEFDVQRNVIYGLVSPDSVDALVAMSGSIGQFVGPERLARFYERFRPLPMVSIAMALDGIPSVMVDNRAGMRSAVTHLIQRHGLRRIAFLRGPETNAEAEERFQTFRDVLEEHHLPFDPNLVVTGNFLGGAGAEAVRVLWDERKLRPEGLVSANDEMALGAIDALRERGIRVPDDVSVIGFDNLDEAMYASPPLTTVRQPLDEQGRKAAEMLLELLNGRKVQERVTLPTELVVRQSCGCFPSAGFPPSVGKQAGREKGGGTAAVRRRRALSALKAAVGDTPAGMEAGWAGRLLDAYSAKGKSRRSGDSFLPMYGEILRRVGAGGGDVMRWLQVLNILQAFAFPRISAAKPSAGNSVWQQARLLTGEMAQWAQAHRRLQSERRAFEFITRISEPLMTAFDVATLTDVVAEQLPKMGIRSCYLSLYERLGGAESATPTEWSRLILAYDEDGRKPLESGGRRFPSRQLVPASILPKEKRRALMLEPLLFRDEVQLGFILFEPLQTGAGVLREALSREISTALQGAMLRQERRRAEDSLLESERAEREFERRLRTLIEIGNELSLAESVDALCRRAVELGITRLGFDRLGIWFRGSEPGMVDGSYGTDERGQLTDERSIHALAGANQMELFDRTQPAFLRQDNVELNTIGKGTGVRGTNVQAAMWDGEQIIGLVATDNLLRRRPVTDQDCELLNLFASSLGYLCSRKWAEQSERESEQSERAFEGRLRTLLEIGNELAQTDSVDALCRRAVELGRAKLGFDRLGIWFHGAEPGFIDGAFGTGPDGEIVDERGIHLTTEGMQMEILRQTQPVALLWNNVELRDGATAVVGRGAQAQAAIWNGERVIGFVSMDNLLHHRPISGQDGELLNLFASTFGYLYSRIKVEEALQHYSERLEAMVEERTRELRVAHENLVRREKLATLGQLAATVSHELRNPLATIRISVSSVEEKTRGKELGVERALERIQRNVTRCDNIISELLDFTRIPELNLRPVEFDPWLGRLLDEQALPEGVRLRRELASGATVSIDPERFRRVIINLLDNACQAMASIPGAREAMAVDILTGVEAGGLRIVVSDTGPGISPEVMPHVFEPLFSTKGFGAGLGLSIVKGIVEQHGGEIIIESPPAQGARVTIRLPLGEGKTP
jgi:DNA-binding LacI/PurR family transcriptional regulator/signal transduction histidine kinase